MSLIAIAAVAAGNKGKQPRPDAADLDTAISLIQDLLTERRRTSLTYKLEGKLATFDLGRPTIDWTLIIKLPQNSASRYFNTVVFHSVCQENKRALNALFDINNAVIGGLFIDTEVEYLHRIAHRNGLDLNFRGVFRRDNPSTSNDLRAINLKRRIVNALDAGNYSAALRSISTFAHLCRAER